MTKRKKDGLIKIAINGFVKCSLLWLFLLCLSVNILIEGVTHTHTHLMYRQTQTVHTDRQTIRQLTVFVKDGTIQYIIKSLIFFYPITIFKKSIKTILKKKDFLGGLGGTTSMKMDINHPWIYKNLH